MQVEQYLKGKGKKTEKSSKCGYLAKFDNTYYMATSLSLIVSTVSYVYSICIILLYIDSIVIYCDVHSVSLISCYLVFEEWMI